MLINFEQKVVQMSVTSQNYNNGKSCHLKATIATFTIHGTLKAACDGSLFRVHISYGSRLHQDDWHTLL